MAWNSQVDSATVSTNQKCISILLMDLVATSTVLCIRERSTPWKTRGPLLWHRSASPVEKSPRIYPCRKLQHYLNCLTNLFWLVLSMCLDVKLTVPAATVTSISVMAVSTASIDQVISVRSFAGTKWLINRDLERIGPNLKTSRFGMIRKIVSKKSISLDWLVSSSTDWTQLIEVASSAPKKTKDGET